jgi:hypothetical protein
MDPILDSRLKAIEEKLEKNHQILTRIRRVQRNGQLFKVFYWVLILMLAFGSFYFIQPYLSQLLETYTGVQTSQEQMQNSIPNLKNASSLIDQFKASQQ